MVTITSLWLAILLAAAATWITSALIWTVLPWHKHDFAGLPNEAAARSALAPQNLAPGQYNIPHCTNMSELKEPSTQQKYKDGPVGFLTVLPRGVPAMGKSMALSGVYYVLISLFVAYLATRTLAPGEDYLSVFRVTSTTAWLAYGTAIVPDAIWFGRPWSGVIKNLMDALIYALLVGGAFGSMWPGA
jgi:hypothetical protein